MNETAKGYFSAFYHKNRLNFALTLVFTVLCGVAEMSFSWLLGSVTDAIAAGDVPSLRRLAALTAVAVPLLFVLLLLFYRFKTRFIHKGLRQYKALAFARLSEKSISAFAGENTGRYLSALTNDAGSIEENYLNRSVLLPYQSLLFVLALGMMLWYSPLLTAVAVLLCLLPLLISLLMGRGLSVRERRVSDRNERFTAQLKDLLSGFPVIKSFKAEAQARALFEAANEQLERDKEDRRWYSSLLTSASQLSGVLMQFGIFFASAWLSLRGQITVGTVLIFVNLCHFLVSPINTVPEYWASRKAARGLVEKLAALTEENTGHGGVPVPPKLRQGIRAQGLSFGYEPGMPVLKDLSFRLEAGKCYAIVGASGSGKSSLLQLLMGAYPDYEGSLTLDGQELRGVDTDSLYELMSLVGQNVFLFDDSIRNNITMFSSFPEGRVQEAMDKAGLSPIVAQRGGDYRCGENGARLSGGERQRIAIARSLLKGADILLVDEATSALDNETARHVAQAILGLDGLTRIVVTHRLDAALLARYDSILMLKNGSLCEQGSFQELMAERGQFYSLYTVSTG